MFSSRHVDQPTVPARTFTSTLNVTIKTPSATDTAPCKFCKKLMSLIGITYHQVNTFFLVSDPLLYSFSIQAVCVKNPTRNSS